VFTMMMETTIDNHGITLEAAATNNVTETKSQPKDRIQKSNTLNTNEKMVSSSKKIHTSPRRRLKKNRSRITEFQQFPVQRASSACGLAGPGTLHQWARNCILSSGLLQNRRK